MLQRLIYKSPSPVRTPNYDNIIFTKEGKIRDYIIPICQDLKIDVNDLYPKDLKDFSIANAPENVQILRFNNCEIKRQFAIENIKAAVKQKYRNKKSRFDLQSDKKPSLSHTAQQLPSLVIPILEPKKIGATTTTEKRANFFFTELPISARHSKNFPMTLDTEKEINTQRTLEEKQKSKGGLESHRSMGYNSERKNRDNSVDSIVQHNSVRGEMMRRFEDSIKKKMTSDERLANATKLIYEQKMEQERRLRENLKIREEKRDRAAEKLENKKRSHSMQIDKKQQQATERRLQYQRSGEISRFKDYQESVHKFEDCKTRREKINDEKSEQYTKLNKTWNEKSNSFLEKRLMIETLSIPIALSRINEKINSSILRKGRALSTRFHRSNAFQFEIDKRCQKIKEDEEANKMKIVEKLVDKMNKGKILLEEIERKRHEREHPPSVERQMVHDVRMKIIKEQEEEAEKQFAQDVKEKDVQSAQRIGHKKAELADYITERQEVWAMKMENVHTFRQLVAGAEEKRMKEVRATYRDRLDQVTRDKLEMQKKREEARAYSKALFERRNFEN